jgi:hypothetical protein
MLDKQGYRHTHSEYVKVIAFLRQKWIDKRASILRHSVCLSVSLLTANFSFLTFQVILRHHVSLSCLLYVRSSSHVLINEPVSYSNLGPPVSIIPRCPVRYANELVVLFRWVVSWAVRPRDSANLKTWRQYNIINCAFYSTPSGCPIGGQRVCSSPAMWLTSNCTPIPHPHPPKKLLDCSTTAWHSWNQDAPLLINKSHYRTL